MGAVSSIWPTGPEGDRAAMNPERVESGSKRRVDTVAAVSPAGREKATENRPLPSGPGMTVVVCETSVTADVGVAPALLEARRGMRAPRIRTAAVTPSQCLALAATAPTLDGTDGPAGDYYREGVADVTVPERFRGLVADTADLAERFSAAGHRIYLVGGSVRDALLEGDAPVEAKTDLDLTTDALPDQIEVLIEGWADAVWTQGKRFGTIGARHRGKVFEITTHRAEHYHPDSRKPDVTFGDSIDADLARRDFTINAMALELPGLTLHDPHGGLADLAAGVLRTPLDPRVSFEDDPLRMLRAARFSARFDLAPDPDLLLAIAELADRLSIVSAERIREELDRMMMLEVPSRGLWFVVETGLAEHFLPELPGLALEQDPIHHHKDVLAHTMAVIDKTSPIRLLRLAAMFHDVGKPKTRNFVNGGVTFHHHEVVGARMTRRRMEALRYSNEDTETVVALVELHLRFHTYRLGWTDKAVRRYVRDAGPLLDLLNELTRCDCTTRNARKARQLDARMDELEVRIAELRDQEELDAIRPDLDGAQIMEHLGIAPSREVGQALNFLLELRMDEGPLGEEEARRRLDGWWAARAN